MINIFTDSTSDLGVRISSMSSILRLFHFLYQLAQDVFLDGVNIYQKELFALVKRNGELPKTAAPSVGEFIKAFDML